MLSLNSCTISYKDGVLSLHSSTNVLQIVCCLWIAVTQMCCLLINTCNSTISVTPSYIEHKQPPMIATLFKIARTDNRLCHFWLSIKIYSCTVYIYMFSIQVGETNIHISCNFLRKGYKKANLCLPIWLTYFMAASFTYIYETYRHSSVPWN